MADATERGVPDTRRRAGILLHVSSLPDAAIGPDARRFVDFAAASGASIWQLLPVNPTDVHGSPYQSISLHAGNPASISLDDLVEQGWLEADDRHHGPWLARAMARFASNAAAEQRDAFSAFRERNAYWLEDYALFATLCDRLGDNAWWRWPEGLRAHDEAAIAEVRRELHDAVEAKAFEQFLFFEQWRQLADYAHGKGLFLFGDMPIYPAHNSVDVWANQALFLLDDARQPRWVGGVPPDAFSATGQRWGNPVYNWDRMQATGFGWWLDRIKSGLALFDCLRIDHFRGFCACWHIVASAPGAQTGEWHPVPGHALLEAVRRAHPRMPFIAEDLGVITADVDALRDAFGLPGIRVLQFAFDGNAQNPHLPHNHARHMVSFTGTHDNNTTRGWFDALSPPRQSAVLEYLGHPTEAMPWPLIRANLASVADIAVVPMQDWLALGEAARMNMPGTATGNWRWRFSWEDVPPDLPPRIAAMIDLYGRATSSRG